CRAAGCTPPKVAMRSITSLRRRSGRSASTSEARSRSRWTRIVAMICGCSSTISSATFWASSQFRASMPLAPSLPSRMSSMRPAARSVPRALLSTERMYSSEPSVIAMNWSASWRNSSSTLSTSPRVTCLRLAMAVPICCTSRAERNLKTSAAPSSPSDMIRMAQRSSASKLGLLVAIFLLNPRTQHHGDGARVLLGHGARRCQVFLVAAQFVGTTFGGLQGGAVLFDLARLLFQPLLGLGHVLDDGSAQTAPQQDGRGDDQQVLQYLERVLDVGRVLPEPRLLRTFFAEQAVHNAHGVAALGHEAHRLLYQGVDLLDFFLGQG